MNNFKSHFKFNKQEQSGIFFLLLFIILLQSVYYFVKTNTFEKLQGGPAVDQALQTKIDSLKTLASKKDSKELYQFNPNFITDHKGYVLGMSPNEIDRLHAFRKSGKYVNSPTEFQQVTQVSDSLLAAIAPSFRFPEWTQEKSKKTVAKNGLKTISNIGNSRINDLNSVNAAQLKSIYGIGEKLSARIVKFRNRLGGFLIDDQLYDVYGLEREVADRVLKEFKVLNPPQIEKINVNTASFEQIRDLVYIDVDLARKIVIYRNSNGPIESLEELFNIEGFPINRIDRIKLYLSL